MYSNHWSVLHTRQLSCTASPSGTPLLGHPILVILLESAFCSILMASTPKIWPGAPYMDRLHISIHVYYNSYSRQFHQAVHSLHAGGRASLAFLCQSQRLAHRRSHCLLDEEVNGVSCSGIFRVQRLISSLDALETRATACSTHTSYRSAIPSLPSSFCS